MDFNFDLGYYLSLHLELRIHSLGSEIQQGVHYRYMSLHKGYTYAWLDNGPNNFNYTFTSTFYDTISPIQDIYYSSERVRTSLYIYEHPGNSSKKNLEYSFDVFSNSTTYLTTSFSGLLNYPQYFSFYARYLIVLVNSTLFGDYVTITTVQFQFNLAFDLTDNITQLLIPLPNNYTTTSNIKVMPFLRDVKAEYATARQAFYSNIFQLSTTNTIRINNTVLTTLVVKPYFFDTASRFKIRYFNYHLDTLWLSSTQHRFRPIFPTIIPIKDLSHLPEMLM